MKLHVILCFRPDELLIIIQTCVSCGKSFSKIRAVIGLNMATHENNFKHTVTSPLQQTVLHSQLNSSWDHNPIRSLVQLTLGISFVYEVVLSMSELGNFVFEIVSCPLEVGLKQPVQLTIFFLIGRQVL